MAAFALIIFCAVVCRPALFAQGNASPGQQAPSRPLQKMVLTATSAGDSIILRWAPTDPVDWKLANTAGYILERTTLSADNKVEVRFERLGALKPWSKEVFMQNISKANSSDKYMAIAAQALYGASFRPLSEANKPPAEFNEFQLLMKQNQEDIMRHSFALYAADVNAKAAVALGLRYVDKNVDRNKKYIYRVYTVGGNKLLNTDTALYIISPKDVSPINRVTFVKGSSHNRAVFLDWPRNGAENNFTGFFIERSADDGKTFVQLNNEPFTNLNGTPDDLNNTFITYADTVPQLNKKYVYRVRGINSFAQNSPYSLPVIVTAKDDNPPLRPEINKTAKLNARTYKVSWKDVNAPARIKGFYIGRSKALDSNFVQLNKDALMPAANEFKDSTARPGQSYYYNVTVLDTAGNSSTSLPDYVFTYDTTAPSRPVSAGGSIDTNGVVTLHWPLGPEEDIQGYRIYKANAADHEFTAVSKEMVTDTVYHDTIPLKTLTKEIFYKIVAVDNNLNNSDYSPAARLLKPDVIPPVPAVFTNYITSDTSIRLYWNKSTSDDLAKQYLYRKTGAAAWQMVAAMGKGQAEFTDTTMRRQTLYSYQIISEDSAGLKSAPSFPLNAQTFASARNNAAGEIKAAMQADSSGIKVEWALKGGTAPANILLYRSVNGGAFTMYANVPALSSSYIDKNVSNGNTYGYSFKCIYAGNSESLLSKGVTVEIK